MDAIFFDARVDDDTRRKQLYQGQLFVYSAGPSSLGLCDHARSMIADAFAPLDPRTAQYDLPVEKYAAILAELKPAFIHHPKSKQFIQGILGDLGCDPLKTYFDVPRMRSATHGDYLTTGIAYAFHPHRDTWYSAPFSQINFWMPIYDIEPANSMAFHLRYWSQPVRNGSREYNYDEWNRTSRKTAAQHIKSDTRKQPKPEEPVELDPQIRVIAQVGGLLVFSGAHLHSTVPNTSGYTRFSIDFRTVHLDDVERRAGAPNIDSACTGTTMRDYLRASDLSHLPEDLIALYDTPAPEAASGVGTGR